MSADAHSVFDSDEPSLRRLTLAQTGLRRQQSFQQARTHEQIEVQHNRSESPDNTSSQSDTFTQFSDKPPFGTSVLVSSQAQIPPFDRSDWSNAETLSANASRATTFAHNVQGQMQRALSDQVTPIRLAGHVSVLVVAAVILVLSQIGMPNWELTLRAFPTTLLNESGNLSRNAGMQVSQYIEGQDSGIAITTNTSLQPAVVPFTIIPEKSKVGIQSYIVQAGDTVSAIASKFGLRPESIQWANPSLELNPDLLKIGDELSILPIDGALHRVQLNDTLSSIAAKYKVSIDDVVNYELNELVDALAPIAVGTQLIIPGGVKPYIAPQIFAYNGTAPSSASKGTGSFGWPTSGSITQRFWSGHKAIDIGSWTGAPVNAVDNGHVTVAQKGWNNGYGKFVIIDHGNGYVSLYAHLNSIFVRSGENVGRGAQIGTVGNTGNSTGPHLHFEIRYQGTSRNPFSYLN